MTAELAILYFAGTTCTLQVLALAALVTVTVPDYCYYYAADEELVLG
jgi:hypothetical protein